jgi:hypothetical protein
MDAATAFRYGSIRVGTGPVSLVAQTAPAPAANAPVPAGIATDATTLPTRPVVADVAVAAQQATTDTQITMTIRRLLFMTPPRSSR